MKDNYDNIISLGFFCSVASELERVGLRSASYPFDWLISGFEGVIAAIETHFEDFLLYENMAQNKSNPSFYKDIKYNMQFYHDFDEYRSLRSQLPVVKKKYGRRIKRFYDSITSPTMFLRYIESQDEVDWIEKNYENIFRLLKSYNSNNNIIWIANSEIHSNLIEMFHVQKDENDSVARRFLESNEELMNFFNAIDFYDREKNLDFYKLKQQNTTKSKKNYKKKLIKIFRNEYSHSLKY